MLVGPKGAGKSTIGQILAADLGIHFASVEPIFLDVRARLGAAHPLVETAGFQAVLGALRTALGVHHIVCFETSGASAHVPWLLDALRQEASVRLIRVLAVPDQCLARIRSRDASIHIPVPEEQIERINAIADAVVLPWAAEIDNRGPLDRASIVSTVRNLLTPGA